MTAGTRRAELRLDPRQFALSWKRLGLGVPPAALATPAGPERPGPPMPPEEDLAPALRLLATAQREVTVLVSRQPEIWAVAVASGDAGLLVTRSAGLIRLRPAFGTALPRLIVSVAPTLRGGPGRSVSLPSGVFDEACGRAYNGAEDLTSALRARRVRAIDAEALGHMLSGITGGGQFGAAMRDRAGRRHAAAHTVSFLDTERGRYLLEQRGTYDGASWTTVAPGNPARVTAQVQRMLADLARTLGWD
ncbi:MULTISPECIES: ESX secretion-associated protein EspG [unclassified Crossiella]|uniref:ESX secretion-associated protein EspG n=1 Tax=unclassified Crossiella TaxID=2620835 RepID=UPI001FFF473C|nr:MULTISPECIES: ESX secretion-associated protein EspG [unclassified Crossiella]MCK2237333.1 ESX secretion-associated protein EspG [Crossiella sp. S99.2]MCK2250988.1 ESX secretion-associated protein EspG [Crossiella sp. S99.1]